MYVPGDFVQRVSPTPRLMLVADHDQIADLALNAYERALESKRLVMIKGGSITLKRRRAQPSTGSRP